MPRKDSTKKENLKKQKNKISRTRTRKSGRIRSQKKMTIKLILRQQKLFTRGSIGEISTKSLKNTPAKCTFKVCAAKNFL